MEETSVMNQDFGKITFANEVLATIAGIAACDVEGVAGMAGGLKDGIVELLGRKSLAKGVKILIAENSVSVELDIIVNYGAKLPAVCDGVQDSVIKALESMTGLTVTKVDISVEGLKFPDAGETA